MVNPGRTIWIVNDALAFGQAQVYAHLLQHEADFPCKIVDQSSTQLLEQQLPQHFDGILLELLSPTTGLNLLLSLKSQLGHVCPPIVTVGDNDLTTAVAALKAGAADYLVKEQLTPDALCLAFRTAIENAELKRELQLSQEQFRTSVETMLECFGIFSSIRDQSGRIIDFQIDYLNQAACENNQLPYEAQVGRRLCEVLPGHRASGLFAEYCQLVETGEPVAKDALIYERIDEDKRTARIYDLHATRFKDGFVASWRDVTERQQIELALRESQQHYQALAEATPQIVWIADAAGSVTYWNQRWYEYTGLTLAESAGPLGMSAVHPEDCDRTLAQWQQTLAAGEPVEIEYRIRRRDGQYRWFINRSTPRLNSQGQITGWLGTITDINDQKQLVERFQLMIQAVNGLVFDWDLVTDQVYRSDKLHDLVGVAAEAAPAGASWWQERIHPHDLTRLQNRLQELWGSTEKRYEAEYQVRHQDGRWIDVWERGCLVRNDQGEVIRIVGSTVDITEEQAEKRRRQQAEQELRNAHIQLESALEAGLVYTWRWSIPDNRVITNQSFAHLFNVVPEDAAAGLQIEEFLRAIHPDDKPQVTEAITKAIDTRADYTAEFRVRGSDHLERWVVARGRVEYDSQGNPVALPGALADITERKQIEAALQQKMQEAEAGQQILNALMEYIPEGITIAEAPDVIIRQVSRYGQRLTGRPTDTLNGIPFEAHPEAWQVFYPDGKTLAAAASLPLTRAVQQGEIVTNEEWIIRKPDGQPVVILCNAGPIRNSDGAITGGILAWRDISDLKQVELERQRSEAILQSFIAASPIALALFDRDLKFLYVNEALASLNDLPINAHLGGSLEAVLPHMAEQFAPMLRQITVTQEPVLNLEFNGEIRPGVWRSTIANHYPVCLPGGEVIGVGVAIVDVSALTQAQQHLRESEERFRTLADNISQFAWMTDATGWIFWYNQRWFDYTGASFEEMQGWGWQQVHHPDHVERVVGKFKASIQAGQPWEDTFPLRCKDGQYRWFLSRAIPVHDDQGQVVRWFGTNTDITELRRTELALQQTTERLNVALKSAPITLFYQDTDLRYTWIYKPSPNLTGEEVLGRRDEDLLDSESAAELIRLKQQVLDTGVGLREEVKIARSGQTRYYDLTIDPVWDEHNITVGVACAAVDISDRVQLALERQRALAELEANEARLRGFVEANLVGIIYGDIYGGISEANDEFLNMLGYSRSHLQTGRLRWLDITPPEYLPLDELALAEAQERGACTPYEKEYLRQDGSRVPVLLGYSLINADEGKTVAFVLDLSDLKQTEEQLRQSEDRLRIALKSAQLGTWDWDLNTNQLTWDEGCKAMFGLSPTAHESVEVFFATLHPDDQERVRQLMQAALMPGSDGDYEAEYRTIGIEDRVERWIRAVGQVYFGPGSCPLRFVGVVLDISQQKQIEVRREALLQREQAAREAAESANRIKDEFLAILSHELRSPLNPILGWASLLQTKRLDADRTARALATIERNAKLQAQLIDDILDVARILRGKLKLERTLVNPAFVIEAAIETVQAAATEKTVSIHTDLQEVGQIRGDLGRLQQIIWNLLTNAVKFTPTGGRINVSLVRVEHWAQIQVADTGMGIRADFLPYIFDSFRQEDTSITRQFGGLGLGLAIVRYLVEAHGGTIAADSSGEGQGAVFTVNLPLLPNKISGPTADSYCRAEPDLTGVRILAVDDNLDMLELLAVSLAQYGAQVQCVGSAAEALSALVTFQPAVLVSDIGMPGTDGYTFMQQVRSLSPEQGGGVPAIALTAYVREEDRQKALDSGFQKHIAKPVTPELLAFAVAELTTK